MDIVLVYNTLAFHTEWTYKIQQKTDEIFVIDR